VLEHLVDGVGVEQPFIDGRSIDLGWNRTGLIPFDRVPLFFVLLGQVVIADPSRTNRSGTDTARGGTR